MPERAGDSLTEDAVCPECGSTDITRIVYGLPTAETRARYAGEQVSFGGCLCFGDERDPQFACRRCHTRFGEVLPIFFLPDWVDE